MTACNEYDIVSSPFEIRGLVVMLKLSSSYSSSVVELGVLPAIVVYNRNTRERWSQVRVLSVCYS